MVNSSDPLHAMQCRAVLAVQELLPAIIAPDRVALVGLHAWAEDDIANVAHWGIRSFSPDNLRGTTQPLLDWLAATGCSRVAIHSDVDTIDSNELVLGWARTRRGPKGPVRRRMPLGASAPLRQGMGSVGLRSRLPSPEQRV